MNFLKNIEGQRDIIFTPSEHIRTPIRPLKSKAKMNQMVIDSKNSIFKYSIINNKVIYSYYGSVYSYVDSENKLLNNF